MSTVNNKNQEIYNSAITKSQTHIDEGEALIGLNSALATDELRKAKDILTTASDQISDGSKEQKQIDEKLENVNSLIKQASGGKSISAIESKDPDPMIELKKSDRDIIFVSKDEDNLYALTNNDIYSKNIKTGNKDDLIGNEDYWSSPRGMSVYSGNIYVLDKSDGLIKFVKANDGFAQQSYFKGDVDLSKATGLTIDSSVYILFSDGTIQKYTRGESASFNLTGLDKPFDNPTRIFTYPDASYLYVLDPKNSRIVRLDKEGKVQSQFLVPELANAVEFSVDESKNKAYFLSSGTIYEIDL